MTTLRVNEKIIRDFCKKHMSTHTDWTGTRVETKHSCESVNDFAKKFITYIEDNQF